MKSVYRKAYLAKRAKVNEIIFATTDWIAELLDDPKVYLAGMLIIALSAVFFAGIITNIFGR